MLVLVVEDNTALNLAFSETVRMAGYPVLSATSFESAYAKIEDTPPDVLILDLFLDGGMSLDIADFAACSRTDVEIIFVTGSAVFPNAELFRLAGNTTCCLRKPVDLKHLIELLHHIENTGFSSRMEGTRCS